MSQNSLAHGKDNSSGILKSVKTCRQQTNRVVIAAMAGSFIEWFEFSVYGYLASVMGQVFFPSSTPAVQVIASLAAFAVAFFARPFGGIVFGMIGDRLGRKRALNMTLTTMATATFCIGLIPSHSTIGLASPVLLVLLRLVQGFSGGGEVAGASIFVAEHSGDKYRTLLTSWVEVGCMGGFVFGALVSALLHQFFSPEDLTSWAWRIPFLFAAPMALIGLYIRHRLEESPLFVAAQEAQEAGKKTSSFHQLIHHKGLMLRSAGLIIGANIPLFIIMTYMPTWLVSTLQLSASKSLYISIFPMCLLVITIPLFAYIADRIGRKKVMLVGSLGIFCLAYPCFDWLLNSTIEMKVGALVILNIFLSMILSCIFSKVPALFPVHIRYRGMAVSYNIAVAVFAGTAPMANAWLIKLTGNPTIPAYYLMVGAAVGVITLLLTRDRTGAPMQGDGAAFD